MRHVLLIAAASLVAGSAMAQPLPTPATFPPVTGARAWSRRTGPSLDMAERIARVAIDNLPQDGFHHHHRGGGFRQGRWKAFLRDEKTGPHTVSLAQDKAYTALTLASRFATSLAFATARNSTLGFADEHVRGVTGVGGGVPIKFRGETIGAVGSSGAVGGDKDGNLLPGRDRRRCGGPSIALRFPPADDLQGDGDGDGGRRQDHPAQTLAEAARQIAESVQGGEGLKQA